MLKIFLPIMAVVLFSGCYHHGYYHHGYNYHHNDDVVLVKQHCQLETYHTHTQRSCGCH